MRAKDESVEARGPGRHAVLPRDPHFVKGSSPDLDIPEHWYIEPKAAKDARLASPNAIFGLSGNGNAGNQSRSAEIRRLQSNESRISHLLARASFGAQVSAMHDFLAQSVGDIVEALLFDEDMPEPPGEWVSESFDRQAFRELSREEQQEWRRQNRLRRTELRVWWLELMMSSPLNLREKMTLFWHGHFTSDARSAQLAQYLFIQNDTLRRFALGNFGEFLKAIYKDPAMLLYLNGVQNHAREPNENFARELLELFTMGIGNYTENDIKEAARAFTGWQIEHVSLSALLNPRRHDDGIKTFLGHTGNFAGDDIADIILQQQVTAVHICRKLYEFFVSREVDEGFVQGLANTFRSSNYEIRPVLRELFNSDHFYSDRAVASLIKSPVELAVSNARMLSVQRMNLRYVLNATESLGQTLFSPPNVAGWPGQRAWVSPTTYVTRNTFSQSYVLGGLFEDPESNRAPIRFDALDFARSFGITTARELAAAMAAHLLRVPLSDETLDLLLPALIGSADPADWSLDYPGADRMVGEFLAQIVKLPEFHLT